MSTTTFSKHQVNQYRAVRWKINPKLWDEYEGWENNHAADSVDLRWMDAVVLSRLKPRTQKAAVGFLLTGKADSLPEAIRLVKRAEIVRGECDVPEGQYRTLVIDPPWPMVKIEREAAPEQGNEPYQPMTLEQIGEFEVPAFEEAHLYLWTTHKFLPAAFDIMEGWGFKYIFTMVWHKPGGFQPADLPQYNCEFCLFGRTGGLGFLDTQDFNVCFQADRTGHSQKPDAFYDLIRRVSPAPRWDGFNRRAIEGFTGWGLESPK